MTLWRHLLRHQRLHSQHGRCRLPGRHLVCQWMRRTKAPSKSRWAALQRRSELCMPGRGLCQVLRGPAAGSPLCLLLQLYALQRSCCWPAAGPKGPATKLVDLVA